MDPRPSIPGAPSCRTTRGFPSRRAPAPGFFAPDGSSRVTGKPLQLFDRDGGILLLGTGMVRFDPDGNVLVAHGHDEALTADLAEFYCP